MPTSTYTPLATTTLGAGVSILTFSSISQSYRDIVLVINGKAVSGSGLGIFITLNGDFGSNYNEVYMEGNGSATNTLAVSNAGAATLAPADTNDGVYTINFMDYSATDKHKTFLSRINVAATGTRAMAHRWANTAAVTSIRIAISSSTFVAGTSLSLYGVAA